MRSATSFFRSARTCVKRRVMSTRGCPNTAPARLLRPVVAFEGDQPGRESNVRLAIAAANRHREVVITTLPDGHDPNSWLALRGDAGLTAWTRKGCLDSGTGVRPAVAANIVAGERLNVMRQAHAELPMSTVEVAELRRELVELACDSRPVPTNDGRWHAPRPLDRPFQAAFPGRPADRVCRLLTRLRR
jgi:hypothetical protein